MKATDSPVSVGVHVAVATSYCMGSCSFVVLICGVADLSVKSHHLTRAHVNETHRDHLCAHEWVKTSSTALQVLAVLAALTGP